MQNFCGHCCLNCFTDLTWSPPLPASSFLSSDCGHCWKNVRNGCLCQHKHASLFEARNAQQRQLFVWISLANISVLVRLCGSALHRFSVSYVRNTLMSQQQVWSMGYGVSFGIFSCRRKDKLSLTSLLVISSVLDGYHYSLSFLSFPPFHLPFYWIEAISLFLSAEAEQTVYKTLCCCEGWKSFVFSFFL